MIWNCPRCTYENAATASKCIMCGGGAPRPKVSTATSKRSKIQQTLMPVAVGSSDAQASEKLAQKVAQLQDMGIALSDKELKDLLARNCYCVPFAASAYFEQQANASPTAPEQSSLPENEEHHPPELTNAFDKDRYRLVGSTLVAASITRANVKLQEGHRVILQAENAGKKRSRSNQFSSSKATSGVVRIASTSKAQIGRLSREMELILQPLMKEGLVESVVVCSVPPTSTQVFASFQVRVYLYIRHDAFDIFNEDHPRFHLSDSLFAALEAVKPSASNETSDVTSVSDMEDTVRASDVETLFSGFLSPHLSSNMETSDPAAQVAPMLQRIKLREHQKQALQWMIYRENQPQETHEASPLWDERSFASHPPYYVNTFEKVASNTRPSPPKVCRGGILADDMGMGKTMSVLALLAYQKYLTRDPLATLVVCPLSLLYQWQSEVQSHFKPRTLSVSIYYGDERNPSALTADIVLTTYGVLSKEMERMDKMSSPLFTKDWSRIILDEAHTIKNRQTAYFRACQSLQAPHRWCLTGTPIQNALDDLYALISFLQYEPWSRPAWWKRVISQPYENQEEKQALGRLKMLLSPVLLRRTKYSLDPQGQPLLELPEKRVETVRLEFSTEERRFYDAVFAKSRAEFQGYVATGAAMTSYVAILALLLRLRQACDHPLLALGRHKVQRDDQKPQLFQPRPDESSTDYYHRISHALTKDQTNVSSYLSTVLQQVQEDGVENHECPVCLDVPSKAVLTPCAHVLCQDCLENSLRVDAEEACPVCRVHVDKSLVCSLPDTKDERVKTDQKDVSESVKLGQLKADLMEMFANDPERKVVVFSQWTQMLELVASLLSAMDIQHGVFHGGLTSDTRQQVLQRFHSDPKTRVLVTSLKAGGVGLNLTCASAVILLDPWWNPGVEVQAIDRVHRLGQQHPVLVKKYIVDNTVEDMLLQLQQRKEELAKNVLVVSKSHDDKRQEHLNLDDLKKFFS